MIGSYPLRATSINRPMGIPDVTIRDTLLMGMSVCGTKTRVPKFN